MPCGFWLRDALTHWFLLSALCGAIIKQPWGQWRVNWHGSSFPVKELLLTSACSSWLRPCVTWVLINYSHYTLQEEETCWNIEKLDWSWSLMPAFDLPHLGKQLKIPHIFSTLCQAISQMLRTMAFFFFISWGWYISSEQCCRASFSWTP